MRIYTYTHVCVCVCLCLPFVFHLGLLMCCVITANAAGPCPLSRSQHHTQRSEARYDSVISLLCGGHHLMSDVELCLENFVFEGKEPAANMKLIDFGCAVHAADDQVIRVRDAVAP